MHDRRTFLKLAASCGTMLAAGMQARAGEAAHEPRVLHAREVPVRLLPGEYPRTRLWSYGEGTPGDTLRLAQGKPAALRLVNGLQEPTTVHWHGLRIANAMDGVPGLTQAPVAPGDAFDYVFTPPDAGTFWYHAHTRSHEQVARGLYGALIVEEADPPAVDREEVLVLGDWRLQPEDGQLHPDFTNLHDRSHAGRLGNFLTVNGSYEHGLAARRGERIRLRIINAATARILTLGATGLEGWTMALDGMPLAAPAPIRSPVTLGPGQRADVIVDVVAETGESAWLYRIERDEGLGLSEFRVRGVATEARRPAPAPLPPNPAPEVGALDGARRLSLRMEGGAMGRLDAAILDGENRPLRELAQAGMVWALNGVAGRTEAPLAELSRGETVRLTFINDTAFPHAMHLHGMHFREILPDGALGPMRDTVLLERAERREVALVADNPGNWLLHCHMLAHAAAGMTTWLRVA